MKCKIRCSGDMQVPDALIIIPETNEDFAMMRKVQQWKLIVKKGKIYERCGDSISYAIGLGKEEA